MSVEFTDFFIMELFCFEYLLYQVFGCPSFPPPVRAMISGWRRIIANIPPFSAIFWHRAIFLKKKLPFPYKYRESSGHQPLWSGEMDAKSILAWAGKVKFSIRPPIPPHRTRTTDFASAPTNTMA
jgi:hypothetical protein